VATRWRYEVRKACRFPTIQQLLKQNQQLTGAPEEIRTPDPQIRSLILSNSLTFLDFP
jgi:hypothetical protein